MFPIPYLPPYYGGGRERTRAIYLQKKCGTHTHSRPSWKLKRNFMYRIFFTTRRKGYEAVAALKMEHLTQKISFARSWLAEAARGRVSVRRETAPSVCVQRMTFFPPLLV